MRRAPLALLLAASSALAAAALPPTPARWVTDEAGVLGEATRDRLDRRLERYQGATGHHVLVWIGQLPADETAESWVPRVFSAWGIGRKGQDDGVGIFLFPEVRRVRIEVGYGLEGTLTDLTAARIIRDQMTPRLQRGDWDGAVTAAVDGVLGTVGGEPGGTPRPIGQRPGTGLSGGELLLLAVVGLFVLGFLVTHPSLAVYLLTSIVSGGGRGGGSWGGGGGGGGGYVGGGGRSGGGGASGSW